MIAVIALASVAGGIIAWRFIIPLPALFSLAVVGRLAMAYVVGRRAD
jgi:hypothetical protein